MRTTIAITLLLAAAGLAMAGPDLAVTVAVEPATVSFEGAVTFTTRLLNRGDEPVRYFEPEFVNLDCFPQIRLELEGSGGHYLPYNPPYQSMWSRGLAGTIVTLAPGESRQYAYTRARFRPAVAGREWAEPVALPAGTYRVLAAYQRHDNLLPFNLENFESRNRAYEGLFIGSVESEPAPLVVEAPKKPRISISAPDREKAEVILGFENPTDQEHVFRGQARLVASSKMYGVGQAHPHLPSGRDSKPDEVSEVRVPPGGRVEVRLDLRRLTFVKSLRSAGGQSVGLGELNPQGVMNVRLSVKPEEGEPWSTDQIFVMIPAVEQRGMESFVASAILIPSEVEAGESIKVTLSLRNRGAAPKRIVRRLAFPQEFVVRVEDAEGKLRSIGSVTRKAGSVLTEEVRGSMDSKVAEHLSWDGDAFDLARGLRLRDFTELPPDGAIQKTIDLQARLATGLTPGRYTIRVGYRNVEPGLRFGWEADGRAPTGVIWSEPVTLTVK